MNKAGRAAFSVSRWVLVFALSCTVGAPLPIDVALSEPRPTLEYTYQPSQTLVADLRQGGYVLYLRHTATDRRQRDRDLSDLQACQNQRNLNDQGRQEAMQLRQVFAALKIPVGRVLASPYCRTRETAELAFGRPDLTEDLLFIRHPNAGAVKARQLFALPRTRPAAGTNTVLVGHGANLDLALEIQIAEGEMAIFYPQETGQLALVGLVKMTDWNQRQYSRFKLPCSAIYNDELRF
ncbi:MAG: histidine phosphatase family protein, partial [Gloeomargaritaceae cyanobacterium C42_A2020_066]|nr:histidine phosphatase family protein [Gloeomargaritaceae cyanobacterium C42_A2020_066]